MKGTWHRLVNTDWDDESRDRQERLLAVLLVFLVCLVVLVIASS